jgi:transitional endoplasmic reticulum ATPase
MLAEALANEIGADLRKIQGSDIYTKWIGGSEANIKTIFNEARNTKRPLILFFDEMDAILSLTNEPDNPGSNVRNDVTGIFKQEMNNLALENPNVLVIAATNSIDRIDESIIRSGRFDFKIFVPMPDEAARRAIMVNIISKTITDKEQAEFKIFADDLSVINLAEQSNGFSGADIAEIFRRLALARAMAESRTGKSQPPISQDEIELAIKSFERPEKN